MNRGYNAILLPWEGITFPNNLQPLAGSKALTWDEFGRQVQGLTLRVKFTGREHPLGHANVHSFEPSLGNYNPWHGTLEAFVQMCLENGVGVLALPFENEEFRVDNAWESHAWNGANGGPLTDRSRVLVDRGAIDAAKRRVDAVARLVGPVIVGWGFAEWTHLFSQEMFGVPFDGLRRIVAEQGVPWMEEIVQHIHSVHPAPVGCGIVDKIGLAREFVNEVCRVPGLQWAAYNWYGSQDVSRKMPDLRAAQAYTGLRCFGTQYATWSIGGIAGYERDDAPFPRHKDHEWAAKCAGSMAMGWPEAAAKSVTPPWWGVAHPNLAHVANVTAEFDAAVDWDDWQGPGQAWDTRITGDNLTVISSQGDRRHVTGFCAWPDEGTKVVEISGITEQFSAIKTFDFLTGKQTGEQVVETINGTALFTVPTVGTRGVFYLSPFSSAPVPVYTLKVTATMEMDGQAVRTFSGTLQEV